MATLLHDLRKQRKILHRAKPSSQNLHSATRGTLAAGTIQRVVQDAKSLQGSELLELQRMLGNRAVAGLLNTQKSPHEGTSKLTVGTETDRHERVAHQVARQVSNTNSLQRTADPEVSQDGGHISQSLEKQIQRAKGGGRPVPEQVQRAMEKATGGDYRNVRVHEGDDAQTINEGLGARAATHGNDIFLGRNQSPHDLQLMAHELTHTVQQGAVKNAVGIQRVATPSGTPSIQRDEKDEDKKKLKKLKKKIRQKKAKQGLVKATKYGATAFDWLTTAPLRVIDQLSVMDLHLKDFGNFVKTGKTFKQRRKPQDNSITESKRYKRSKAKRAFGRTGLRAYLSGNKYHKTLYGNVFNEKQAKLPWQGPANPFTSLGIGIGDLGKKEKQLGGKISGLEQERDDLHAQINYNAGDLEMPEEFFEDGGFELLGLEEEEDQQV